MSTQEKDLEVLLKTEDRFPPPDDFAAQANAADPSIYDEGEDYEQWWAKWAKELDWFEDFQTVLEWNPPWAKWFKEGKLNVSHNCLDRHVEAGKGDKVAYHWIGEDDERRDVSYAELLEMTQRFANVLKDLGVQKGDVVGISLEAVRERMEVSDAKVLVTCNTSMRRGKPMPMKSNLDEVVDQLPKLEHMVVVKRTDDDCDMKDGRDIWWHELCADVDADCPAEALDAEHPLYILYTSGS